MADLTTLLSDLIDPEVIGAFIEQDFLGKLTFSQLAEVDNTLVGTAGDTITLPSWTYLGDATEVGEGEPIDTAKITANTATVTIKKIAKGFEVTDEAVLSGYGNPVNEGSSQLGTAIARKINNDCLDALLASQFIYDGTANILTEETIRKALALFGEKLEGQKVLIINPAQLADLRGDKNWINASELQTGTLVHGAIGQIWGCDIVLDDKITLASGEYTNLIVKPGALKIYTKRDTMVETQRLPKTQKTHIYASKLYAAYLYDPTKAVVVEVLSESPGPAL
jgi:N4-gp56 family major capsid protein